MPADATLGFRANTDILFSDKKGRASPRTEKRQRKLARSAPFLPRFLEPGEEVLFFCTGCSPMSFAEQLLTGSIVIYLKRSLFVFTNRRIFHVPTTASFAYRQSVAEIRYGDVAGVRMRGHTMTVQYRGGSKEKFHFISRGERGKLKVLLSALKLEGAATPGQGRHHLCPRCTTPLQHDVYTCTSCRLEFKDADEGRKYSLIFPGGGYFYTRHPIMGVNDAIAEIVLIVFVVIGLFGLANDMPGSLALVLTFGLFLVIEKSLSVYHAKHFIHEYIPKDPAEATSQGGMASR